mmetsp:Transcript_25625/g.82523  ORF Transcript_25625/g.82523 Transcript_25625/m.82523 type:complete len:256 (+) Transcript_25625:1008-1775(+)
MASLIRLRTSSAVSAARGATAARTVCVRPSSLSFPASVSTAWYPYSTSFGLALPLRTLGSNPHMPTNTTAQGRNWLSRFDTVAPASEGPWLAPQPRSTRNLRSLPDFSSTSTASTRRTRLWSVSTSWNTARGSRRASAWRTATASDSLAQYTSSCDPCTSRKCRASPSASLGGGRGPDGDPAPEAAAVAVSSPASPDFPSSSSPARTPATPPARHSADSAVSATSTGPGIRPPPSVPLGAAAGPSLCPAPPQMGC